MAPAKDVQRTQFNFLIGQRRLHGNPLQCSGLENPMDRGGWWATVHGVTESDTKEVIGHAHTHVRLNNGDI